MITEERLYGNLKEVQNEYGKGKREIGIIQNSKERRLQMKRLSYILAAIGTALFVYASIFRFVKGSTVFGYIFALQAKTVVLGANTLLLIAILAWLYARK